MEATLILSDNEKKQLVRGLIQAPSPYKNYLMFKKFVKNYICSASLPSSFVVTCKKIKLLRDTATQPHFLIKNCPLDEIRPIFSQIVPPLEDKYEKKKTFVSEAFLQLFNELTETPTLAYETRNNGDFFHDVYANNKYTNTQTQKTDGELYYHNDRSAHPLRPHYLALLGMRCCSENKIYTSYIDGKSLNDKINKRHQLVLRKKLFQTPYDTYSRDSNPKHISSEPHSIIDEASDFRYHDTRTKPLENASLVAFEALLALKNAIVQSTKVRVNIAEGDLFSFPNRGGLHAREIIEINNNKQSKIRWLLKTYSFKDNDTMRLSNLHFDSKIDGLIHDR